MGLTGGPRRLLLLGFEFSKVKSETIIDVIESFWVFVVSNGTRTTNS